MNRIETLSQLTQGINTLLDIGTDHGYVIIDALRHGYIQNAIACDINKMPLENAKQNIEAANLTDRVTFKLSNGFQHIDGSYDGVLIAGMGMHLVKDILSQKHVAAQKYILQSNNHVDLLRDYLSKHDFKIMDEVAVHDKFHYVILVCEKGKMNLNAKDMFVGPILKNKKEALPYYQHQMAVWVRNHAKAKGEKQAKMAVEIAYLSDILEFLKQL